MPAGGVCELCGYLRVMPSEGAANDGALASELT